MSNVSATIFGSSTTMTENACGLSEQARQQAATLEQIGASVKELTTSVNQVSQHAQSQAATRQATGTAGEGAGAVDRVVG